MKRNIWRFITSIMEGVQKRRHGFACEGPVCFDNQPIAYMGYMYMGHIIFAHTFGFIVEFAYAELLFCNNFGEIEIGQIYSLNWL